jgi:hypothetical protein
MAKASLQEGKGSSVFLVVFVCRGCCNKIIHAHIQAKKQSQQIKQLVHMDEMLDMDETLTSFLFSTLLYFRWLLINSQKENITNVCKNN